MKPERFAGGLALALGLWAAAPARAQEAAAPAPATAADQPRSAGTEVPVPKRSKFVQPEYPAEALAKGLRGIVILALIIDPAGKVANVEVVRSLPPFDDAATTAARQWEYEVTKVDGKAVPVRLTVPITFALKLPELNREAGIPELRQGVTPPFPADAPAAGPMTATADLTIDPSGQVVQAEIKQGESPWSEALMLALRTWRFTPTGGDRMVSFQVRADFFGAKGSARRVELKASGLRQGEPPPATEVAEAPPGAGQPPPAAAASSPTPSAPSEPAPTSSTTTPVASTAEPNPPAAPPTAPATQPDAPAAQPATGAPPATASAAQPNAPATPPVGTAATPATAAPQTTPPAAPAGPTRAPAAGSAAAPGAGTPATGAPPAGAQPTGVPATGAPAAPAAGTPAPPPVEVIPPAPVPPKPIEPGVSAVQDVLLGPGVPDLSKGRRPVTPPIARMNAISGNVEVRFIVEASGSSSVRDVDGPEMLKEAARQTVASWMFRRTTPERLPLVAVFAYVGDGASASVKVAE